MIAPQTRQQHLDWLLQITQLPTAAGREGRVVNFLRAWAASRPDVTLTTDPSGNLHLALPQLATPGRPVYFTAHLDHPAFLVERIIDDSTLLLSFRGGVMAEYFKNARVRAFASDDSSVLATLTGDPVPAKPFTHYHAKLDTPRADCLAVGDIARWDLPDAQIKDNTLYTHACDDLAALAAALAAFDVLRTINPRQDVRLLLTRAEEVGFIGAIAACRHQTMPMDARVIALENSRAFAESPVHGGPIVRVGDRLSVFSPSLTAACAARAEALGGTLPTAQQKISDAPWKWQRKLMAGGACEASVFCHAGYEATCLCLPLGNYHNMGDLDAIQKGTATRPATIEPEFIGIDDFHGLVDLLIACGEHLPPGGGMGDRVQKLWADLNFVLA